jgi:S-DNA-T family DNA segregation ATPase FtsK/SpoIIIE
MWQEGPPPQPRASRKLEPNAWLEELADNFIQSFVVTPLQLAGKGAIHVASQPLLLGGLTGTGGVVLGLGEEGTRYALGALTASPVLWSVLHWPSFRRLAIPAVRDYYRRQTIYRHDWHKRMVACGVAKREGTEMKVPKIQNVSCSEYFDHVRVKLLPGQSRAMVQKMTGELAPTFNSEVCRVRKVHGKPRMVRLDFQRKDALADVIPPFPIPIDEPVDLEAVPMGRTEYGDTWLLNLVGTHIVIGGATGSGKASVLWSMLRGIAPAIRDGLVEVWAFDPKGGMELGHGKPMFTRYWGENADIPDMAEGLHELTEVVKARSVKHAEDMSRKHHPTVDDPLILCVIDELADLTQYPDKKVRDAMIGDVEFGLRRARSVGVSYVMALQKVAKQGSIPFRDLIPDGIALRLDESWMVDAILGPGAYGRGADCPEIPGKPGPGQSIDGRGVAYITQMGDPEPLRVRASYPTDADLAEMVQHYPAFDREAYKADRLALDEEFEVNDEQEVQQ